jgi:hypothetical protein
VCLRCRQEERDARRRHRLRIAAKIGLLSTGSAALLALIVAGISAIASDASSVDELVGQSGAPAPAPARPAVERSRPASTPTPAPAPPLPVIASGRSYLGDSVFVDRTGGSVLVHFDTETLRTRFVWKFEAVIRSTLPAVFGPDAGAALELIPEGEFVRGDLLRELPTRGLRLGLESTRGSITIWPVTRPGRDGPIVVAYKAEGSL